MGGSANVLEFTDGNFETEVLKAAQPVLVDFWAPWCGPCRAIAPLIDQLADENQGKVKIGKLNVDDAQGVAQRYRVMSIPTLIVFKDGEIVSRFEGVQPKSRIQQAMDSAQG